ncbi:MAG: hypothetical protein HC921_05355 [Synechococcaceae cyanobacterium SM2_3_1]|nr:hypothetical protein [Synechococcaceae cyanobacterium SM2_3_1]
MKPTSLSWWARLSHLPWSRYQDRLSAQVRALFAQGYLLGDVSQSNSSTARTLWSVITLLVLAILLVGNWPLGAALLGGSGVMLWVYLRQTGRQLCPWERWSQWVTPSARPWIWATSSGVIASLVLYGSLSLWMETEQHWLAAAAILEGIATLGILSLLLWESFHRRHQERRTTLEQCLSAIASPDPFQRLTGVRQVQSFLEKEQVQPSQLRLVTDYLRLALEREEVAVAREAILETLQSLSLIPLEISQGLASGAIRSRRPFSSHL